jgi:eukaryotic-like serine/threonine-protein kinase
MSSESKPESVRGLPEAVTELSLAASDQRAPEAQTSAATPKAAAQPPSLRPPEHDSTTGTDPDGVLSDANYVGQTLGDRYLVESVLARGGMGVVYRARHRLLDKQVALKVLRPEFAGNRELTTRFINEAKAASAIGSDHIVNVTDFGELPDGATYIVMEYLDGLPLSRVLKLNGPRLAPSLVIDLARQVATGLGKAHAAQIIHRDLKPDNLLVLRTERNPNFVKILDFGIAKVASSQNETTRAGRIFGTPHYMSPEQARGDSLDLRTDIYALGVMLFEMLTGTKPFDAESPLGVLTQHLCVEAPLLVDRAPTAALPLEWEAVVACCLAKKREDRYASLSDLDADLVCLGQGTTPSAVARLRKNASVSPRLYAQLRQRRLRETSLRIGVAVALASCALFAFAPVRARLDAWTLQWLNQPPQTSESAPRSAVDLVLSPIDAHVFRGSRDLGPMPIRVDVRRDRPVELSIRRAGFTTRRISVDGSMPRVEVVLSPLAGSTVPSPRPAVTFGPPRTIILEGTAADEIDPDPSSAFPAANANASGDSTPEVASSEVSGTSGTEGPLALPITDAGDSPGASPEVPETKNPRLPPGPPPRAGGIPSASPATDLPTPVPGPPPREPEP